SWDRLSAPISPDQVVDDRTGCQRQVGEPVVTECGFRRDQDLSLLRSDTKLRQPSQRRQPEHAGQGGRRVIPFRGDLGTGAPTWWCGAPDDGGSRCSRLMVPPPTAPRSGGVLVMRAA